MTVPELLRRYAEAHGFDIWDPRFRRYLSSHKREVVRLAGVLSRRPTVILILDSERGLVRFGQDRVRGRVK